MRKLRTPLAWAIVILVAAGGTWYYLHWRKARQNEVTYRTAPVERRDVVVSVSGVGVLEPLTTVEVKANVAGEIVELAVDRGDYVSAGDLIARIDPTETRAAYEQARVRETMAELHRQQTITPEQVRVAEDAVETAEARIGQAESALEFQRKTTAADIRRGEQTLASAQARLRQAETRAEAQPELTAALVAQAEAEQALRRLTEATHPQERADAKSALDAAKIAVGNDRKAVSRLQALYEKGSVPGQQVEDAQTQLAASQGQFDSAKATSDAIGEKRSAERKEAEARLEQARAGLKSAQAGESDVAVAQQELKAAEAAVREAGAEAQAAASPLLAEMGRPAAVKR